MPRRPKAGRLGHRRFAHETGDQLMGILNLGVGTAGVILPNPPICQSESQKMPEQPRERHPLPVIAARFDPRSHEHGHNLERHFSQSRKVRRDARLDFKRRRKAVGQQSNLARSRLQLLLCDTLRLCALARDRFLISGLTNPPRE